MPFDATIKDVLAGQVRDLEDHFKGDVGFYYGPISRGITKGFRDFIEKLSEEESKKGEAGRFVMFLNTGGGEAEAAEKMVEIMRYHYDEVFFVVPDYALSAGTILCMAGDKIFMDYSSSLGPIDPQVWNGTAWVPALGYLDKVDDLLKRARDGKISEAEYLILKDQDLAMLSRYEQTRDLTVTLLKKWLVQYKFKDWAIHGTTPKKKGQAVTPEEKAQRAEEVARTLGDNKLWHSHGRMISVETLQSACRLKIDDYSEDKNLRGMIRSYNDLLTDYIVRMQYPSFMHSRNYF